MLENVVIPHVSAPRIQIVIDVINAEPVVNPSFTCGVWNKGAKRLGHQLRQHRIDFIPGVVISEQMRIHYFLDGCLETFERYVAGLQAPQHILAGGQVEMEDLT